MLSHKKKRGGAFIICHQHAAPPGLEEVDFEFGKTGKGLLAKNVREISKSGSANVPPVRVSFAWRSLSEQGAFTKTEPVGFADNHMVKQFNLDDGTCLFQEFRDLFVGIAWFNVS